MIGPRGTYGIRPRETWLDIESLLSEYVRWMELGWIPVAGDGAGNHYAVATESSHEPTGVAMFIDTMEAIDRPAYVVGSDMWHLLRGLLLGETGQRWWPLDKALTLQADPDLARYTELWLPWEA